MKLRTLRHPSVLPLLGILIDKSQSWFAMASEWIPNGDINEFVGVHPDANRLELVRYSLGFLSFLDTEVYPVTVARGCHRGVDVLA